LKPEKLLLALAAGLVAAKLSGKQEQAFFAPVKTFLQDDLNAVFPELNTWLPPEAAEPYLYWLNKAEIEYNLPENLLVRVAYQESRFRDDIISGKTVSSAGALGIMQIVPRWHPNVDPLNPEEAIFYAANYLGDLKTKTGSWKMALAAYNWGIGNLSKKGFDKAPAETKNYVTQIAGDVLGGYA
jgi:soluble lytic murein transglycosylase-like protein